MDIAKVVASTGPPAIVLTDKGRCLVYNDDIIKQKLRRLNDTNQLFEQVSRLGEQGRAGLLRDIVLDDRIMPEAREWAFLELRFNNDAEGMFGCISRMRENRFFESDDIREKRIFSFAVAVFNEYLLKGGFSLYNLLLPENEDAIDNYLCFLMNTDSGRAAELVINQIRLSLYQEVIIKRWQDKGMFNSRLRILGDDIIAKARGLDFLRTRKKNSRFYDYRFIRGILSKAGLYDEVILRDEQILENYLKNELLNVSYDLQVFAPEFFSFFGGSSIDETFDKKEQLYCLEPQSNISLKLITNSVRLKNTSSYFNEIAERGSSVLSAQLQVYRPDILFEHTADMIINADISGLADISSGMSGSQKDRFLSVILEQPDLSFLARGIELLGSGGSDISILNSRLFIYELLSRSEKESPDRIEMLKQALLSTYRSGFALARLAAGKDYFYKKICLDSNVLKDIPFLAREKLEYVLLLNFVFEQEEFYKLKTQNGVWVKRNEYQKDYEQLQILRQKIRAAALSGDNSLLRSVCAEAEAKGLIRFSFSDIEKCADRLDDVLSRGKGTIWRDYRLKALGKAAAAISVLAVLILVLKFVLKKIGFINNYFFKKFIVQKNIIRPMLYVWHIIFGRNLLTKPVIETFAESRPEEWSKLYEDIETTITDYQGLVFWHMVINVMFINVMVFLEVLPGLWNLAPIFVSLIFAEQIMEIIKYRKRVVLGKLFFSRFAAFATDEIKHFSMKRGFDESKIACLPGLKLAEYAMGKISIIYSQESFFISISIFLGLLAFNWISALVFLSLIGVLFFQFRSNIHRHTDIQKAAEAHKSREVEQMNEFSFNTDFRIPFSKQELWQKNVQDKEDKLTSYIIGYVKKSRTIAAVLPGLGMMFNIPLTSVAMTRNLESAFFLHDLVSSVSNAFNAEKILYGFAREMKEFTEYNQYQKTGKPRDIIFPKRLELNNLGIRIPHTGLKIVEAANVNLPIGQLVLLEGDSGQGKTILGQTIAGEDNRLIQTGSASVFGQARDGRMRSNNDQIMEYIQFFAVNDVGVYSIKSFLEKLNSEKQQKLFLRILKYAGIDLGRKYVDTKMIKELFPDNNVKWQNCFRKTDRGEYALLDKSSVMVSALNISEEKKEQLKQIIEQARVKEFHQLSEGQRNRVKLAFFVLFFKDVPIYILDQPLSVVDDEATAYFLKFLKMIARKEDKLIIVIEPKIKEGRELFDVCLKVKDGRLISEPEAEEIVMDDKAQKDNNLLKEILPINNMQQDIIESSDLIETAV